MRWLNRIAYWLRFARHQKELQEELALHRDLVAADAERRRLNPTDARNAARRIMGNETLMREDARAVWLPMRLDNVLQDARYTWRGLRRSPGFALVAVISLALGIGANTAIFSLIDGLLLARLPVPFAKELIQPERVVGVRGVDPRFSRAELRAMQDGPISLAMFASAAASVDIDGVAATLSVDAVDEGYFGLIGIGAQLGRILSPRDNVEANPVVVITDRFWRARLNADPGVLGRVIKIRSQPFTVIGVTPRGFAGVRFPAMADVMIPLRTALAHGIVREPRADAPVVEIVGRRPAAWTLAQTQTTLALTWTRCCATGEHIRPTRGQVMSPATLSVVDVSRGIPQLKVDLRGRYTRILMALMAGVAILLLAACVNVGSLLLARSSARAHELAVRVALGASRARLVTQLLIESLQLALLGAVGGLLVAWWGSRLLARGDDIGDLVDVGTASLSPTILAFTAIVSIAAALVFGLIPASRVVRADLAATMQAVGRRSSRRSSGVLDRGLVALQIALALLLVSGASLLTQTLRNLRETELGFTPERRLVFGVDTRRTAYERQGMTVQMADEMLRAVRALPGVRAAGFASYVPILGGRSATDNVTLPGGTTPADGPASTGFVAVTPSYFTSLGIPVKRGTDVDPSVAMKAASNERDVAVNEAFAKTFFFGRDPLGQLFHDADDGDTTFTVDRIVGVVGDAKFVNPRQPVTPMYFVPVADHDWPYLELVARVSGGDATAGQSIVRTLASIAPGITVNGPSPLGAAIDGSLARERISAKLATLFGAIALALVAVGVYGVMLYQVTQRTREIGIRMALGASGHGVVTMVLTQSLSIVGVGVLAGAPLAVVAGRAVSSQLYGVSPYDVPALLAAISALVAVAIASTLLPARRAVTVDPLITLRSE